MKKSVMLFLCSLLLVSCYHEVELDGYRDAESENLLALNSIVNPDSVVRASVSRTFFFSDKHTERAFVAGLDMELSVNGKPVGTMRYNANRNLYEASVRPKEGDRIEISTSYKGKYVSAADSIPHKVVVKSIEVERRGPMHIYWDNDYQFTYKITFSDPAGVGNYYFLQYDAADAHDGLGMGERDFSDEFVFRQLAKTVNANVPGWTPYSPNGLPFSDQGIDGTTHTLVVCETVQETSISHLPPNARIDRKILLYSISKNYYDYLVGILCNRSDGGIHGGIIDIGIADPVRIHSNVEGGIGILGSYSLDMKIIDVASIVGAFPV